MNNDQWDPPKKSMAQSSELVLSPGVQWKYTNKGSLVGKWLIVEPVPLLRVEITGVCSEINLAYPAMDSIDSLY